jgi:hypothetical protein
MTLVEDNQSVTRYVIACGTTLTMTITVDRLTDSRLEPLSVLRHIHRRRLLTQAASVLSLDAAWRVLLTVLKTAVVILHIGWLC